MSDRIDFGGKPWSAIPRSVLRDAKLSPQAKGGLVTLLSHEEGWVRSAIALLMKENDCGRERARAIMRELVEIGYAEAQQARVGGKFSTAYTIRAESSRSTVSGKPARQTGVKPPDKLPEHRVGATGDGSTVSVNPSAVVDPQGRRSQDGDPKPNPEGQTAASPADPNPFQPTHDQIYLVEEINEAWPRQRALSVPQIVKLNREFGRQAASDALRGLHGFPPDAISSGLFAYVSGVCRARRDELVEVAG